jgi:hypothetical protein
MNLTKTPQPVPHLFAINGIASGSVYIAVSDAAHTTPQPGLAEGKHAVLCTQHGETLELTTRHQITGKPNAKGTYLNDVDLATFSNIADPQLRLYTWHDTFAKVCTSAGITLLLPALLGVLAAAASLFFVLAAANQPPATTAADRALVITAWAAQHGASRARIAENCLLGIEGHQAPPATIPGVSCTPPTTPWWRSTLTGAIVAGLLAIATTLVAVYTLPSHYAFGKKPSTGS